MDLQINQSTVGEIFLLHLCVDSLDVLTEKSGVGNLWHGVVCDEYQQSRQK